MNNKYKGGLKGGKKNATFFYPIRLIFTVEMQVTLRRGLFLFSFLYLFSLSIGASLANANTDVDPVKKSNSNDITEPKVKSDSTDVSDEDQHYDEQTETLNLQSDLSELGNPSSEVPGNENYYDSDEDTDESSQSIISFNFLYYLLQKFKFSNSLSY